ncbi:MAG: ThiF family adenylyltransferase [Nitrospirae bacterium]|nr:ThiF family adenylyltransferase [Nitrospirota bacterium]
MRRKTEFHYQDLTNRNKIFIDQKVQKKIKNARILFAGCGLGSLIAETAVRLGFSHFILADGDQVEVSNLNRQSFDTTHIGVNKAVATASVLRKINPEADVQVFKKFITLDDIPVLIDSADFVINTVDVNPVYFELVAAGQREGKEVVLPYNMGFGSLVMMFNQKSESLSGILKREKLGNEVSFYTRLMEVLKIKQFPQYLTRRASSIYSCMEKNGHSPQIMVGAEIAASLVTTCLIKILSGEEVPLAPDYLYLDIH